MPNDARPIGEKLRDIDEHVRDAHRERGMGDSSARGSESKDSKPFVTDRDTGDEEMPMRSGRG
jgi:hypothetical protein